MTRLPTDQELELLELTSVFTETKNPASAWLAFHLSRKHGLPLPAIVAGEIDRFAEEISRPLQAAWNGDAYAKVEAKDITAAWGCAPGAKPARDLMISRRDSCIVRDYWDKVRGPNGKRPTDAIRDLTDQYNLSDKKIEGILTASRRTLGRADPANFDG